MIPDISTFEQQGEEIKSLISHISEGKLVHAYLIAGDKGVGKRTFARMMAAGLICRSGPKRPCGKCVDCRAVFQEEHPDVINIQRGIPITGDGKKDRTTIPVDDIREMIRLCGMHTLNGRPRVVIISDADKMTMQAQNCLLKTLEEPPDNTFIFLVTEHPDALLSTVISRTRPVHLHAWPDDYIRGVLANYTDDATRIDESVTEAGGSVGKAIELVSDEEFWQSRNEIICDFFNTQKRSDILCISNRWKDRRNEAERLLETIESLVRQMLEEHFHPGSGKRLSSLSPAWQKYIRNADVGRFAFLMDTICETRRQLQSNVNFQAVIEHLLFTLMGEGNIWSV